MPIMLLMIGMMPAEKASLTKGRAASFGLAPSIRAPSRRSSWERMPLDNLSIPMEIPFIELPMIIPATGMK